MKKWKIGKICTGFGGVVLLLGTAGLSDTQDVSWETIVLRLALGIGLLVLSYRMGRKEKLLSYSCFSSLKGRSGRLPREKAA